MAFGVPVVVTDVGGNPEIVEDGVSGWVIPTQSVEALAFAIGDVVDNRVKATTLSEAGSNRFNREFTFDRMLAQYCTVYEEMLT